MKKPNRATTASFRRLFVTLLWPALLMGCSGIPIHNKNGTAHYVILGLGIVSVKEQTGVSVVDSRVVGVIASPGVNGAGILCHHYVEIDPHVARNVVIAVQASPFSLSVKHFDLPVAPHRETNQTTNGGTHVQE